jgi:hypothetical protein
MNENEIEYLDLFIISNTTRIVYHDIEGHSHGDWRDV